MPNGLLLVLHEKINEFCLPHVEDLMRVQFGSQFLCKWVGFGCGIKLALLSDNGLGVLLITAGAGWARVYQTGSMQDSFLQYIHDFFSSIYFLEKIFFINVWSE